MIGYMCATPYHVISAITMALGMHASEESTLIIMDHFADAEKIADSIRKTQVFSEVILYKNNNKTKLNRVKRLANAFIPSKTMRDLAKETHFTQFICFALNFIDLAYIMKCYQADGKKCKFAYGDDGIGTYIYSDIYKANSIVDKILKITGRKEVLSTIKDLYVYKPEYMVENKHFNVIKIQQNSELTNKLRDILTQIWPIDGELDVDGKVLYFEQPYDIEKNKHNLEIEQLALSKAAEQLNAEPIVKMHPRSPNIDYWKKFPVLRTNIPFEFMLLQLQCKPKLMLTVNSTALFSEYFFDKIAKIDCPTILLDNLIIYQEKSINDALKQMCDLINQSQGTQKIYSVESIEEFEDLLVKFKKD